MGSAPAGFPATRRRAGTAPGEHDVRPHWAAASGLNGPWRDLDIPPVRASHSNPLHPHRDPNLTLALILTRILIRILTLTSAAAMQAQPMPQFRIAPEMHGWAGGGPLALPITHPLPAHFATDLVPTLDTHTQPQWP